MWFMPFGLGRSRGIEGETQPLPQRNGLPRRRLLWISALGGGTLGVTFGGLFALDQETKLFTRAINWLGNKKDQVGLYEKLQSFLHPDDAIENYVCSFENATYNASQMPNNVQIGVGDSIQGAYIEATRDFRVNSASAILVADINGTTIPNPHWTADETLPQVGATTVDAVEQINHIPALLATKPPKKNKDVNMSIGGNNIGELLQGNFDERKVDAIISKDLNQIQSDDINYLNTFVDTILATIAGYEEDLFGLLEQYYGLHTLDITFNHIFIKSLPNLGLCDHATFISRDPNVPSFRLELDSPLKKEIATAIAKRFNIAMARAIERFKKAHTMNAPQVILLDLFHLLQAEDLDGIHPTVGGQIKIARYQEERMDFNISPNGGHGPVETTA